MHNKIDQIHIFRFIAALLVIMFHFFTSNFKDVNFIYQIFKHGDEAVSYFFTLSGFIMVVSYNHRLNNKKQWIDYLIARLARIYPLYIFTFLLLAIFHYFINDTYVTNFAVRSIPEVLLVQSWLGLTSLNFPGWSVSVEVFFYIFFPLIFFITNKIGNTRIFIGILLSFVCGQFLINYLLNLDEVSSSQKALAFIFYSPYFHIVSFFMGLSTGVLFTRHYDYLCKNQRKVIFICITLIILLSVVLFISGLGIQVGILAPLYCLFILCISTPFFNTRLLTNKFSVFLGDISYGVYILQFPVMLYFNYLNVYERESHKFMLAYILCLVALSALAHFTIEKHGNRLIKTSFNKIFAKNINIKFLKAN